MKQISQWIIVTILHNHFEFFFSNNKNIELLRLAQQINYLSSKLQVAQVHDVEALNIHGKFSTTSGKYETERYNYRISKQTKKIIRLTKSNVCSESTKRWLNSSDKFTCSFIYTSSCWSMYWRIHAACNNRPSSSDTFSSLYPPILTSNPSVHHLHLLRFTTLAPNCPWLWTVL